MTDKNLSRRTMLTVSGVTLAGLAGCSGSPTGGSNSPTEEAAADDHDEETDGHDESDGHEETDSHDDETDSHDDEDSHDEGEEDGHQDDEGGHGHGGEIGEPVEEADVAMVSKTSGEHFEPHVVRVTEGGTVHWTNESGAHATASYSPDNDKPQLVPDGAESWDSELFEEEGATFEHTFETEGVYHYYCEPHETMGMIGSVIVGEPDPHDQLALEEPPEDMSPNVREKLKELNERCSQALGDTH